MPIEDTFANRLKLARKSKHMTRKELSEACDDVSSRQIFRYENGESNPVLSRAVQLANALSVTIGWLAGEDTND